PADSPSRALHDALPIWMYPAAVALLLERSGARRERRPGGDEPRLERIEVVRLDVAHVEGVAPAALDEATHGAWPIGEGLGQLDAVEPVGIEQRERALVAEAVAADRREVPVVEVGQLDVAGRCLAPV